MAVPPPRTKAALRVEALARRAAYANSLTPELRDELERNLAAMVLPHLAGATAIGLYHPLKAEISPIPLLAMIGPGRQAALPWFAGRDARMIFREAPAAEIGPWGVLQPPADAPAVAPDAVIVPLVLADRHGTRIGHGKGHYDRALAHLREAGPVLTIGVAWDCQISDDAIPPDAWDVPLDAIATPNEWIDCA